MNKIYAVVEMISATTYSDSGSLVATGFLSSHATREEALAEAAKVAADVIAEVIKDLHESLGDGDIEEDPYMIELRRINAIPSVEDRLVPLRNLGAMVDETYPVIPPEIWEIPVPEAK